MTGSPEEITVLRVPDPPEIARYGLAIHSLYLERVYGPIIGPTATVTLRLLAGIEHVGPARFTKEQLASEVGVSPSKLTATLQRLAHHGLLQQSGSTLRIGRYVAPLAEHYVARLPQLAATIHAATVPRVAPSPRRPVPVPVPVP